MAETFSFSEPVLRLACFIVVFIAMAIAEIFAPRRAHNILRSRRWPNNLGIAALNSVLIRALVPTAAVGGAVLAATRGWGVLNQLQLPDWFTILTAIIVLDFAIYLQHRLFHALPALWRLHRMHHADLAFDVTTGVRFHPLEILLSFGIKFAIIVLLGAPAIAVLIFEVLLNATSMFNHSNIRLPLRFERRLRWFLVTPDMHRVHHSIDRIETNRNFGFNLPWWDRLLGTYRAQPAAGHLEMTIGLPEFREPMELRLDKMLLQPFRPNRADAAVRRQ